MHTGSWTQVHHLICLAHCGFIMLDHQYGISFLLESLHGFKKSVIVTWMKADCRLIQHIQHA